MRIIPNFLLPLSRMREICSKVYVDLSPAPIMDSLKDLTENPRTGARIMRELALEGYP
jgi:hypothetical protein